MTHRLIRRWLPAAAFAAAIAAPAALTAQAPPRGSAELIAQLSAKPTPHLNGKPDFNGTWDHLGGIEFIRPQKLPDGSLCLRGCEPAAGARDRRRPRPLRLRARHRPARRRRSSRSTSPSFRPR